VVDPEPAQPGDAGPHWDQSRREVGLVVLQAAVLTRRIFLPAAGSHDLAPEQWQLLIALALIDSAPYAHPTASAESLANQLTLDRDETHALLFSLLSDGLVVAEEEAEEAPARFRLSNRGWEAASSYIERAGRFLPRLAAPMAA
jgi:hypothetical protein